MAKSMHTNEYRSFAALLVKARERAGMTQAEVAARLGKHQSFVAKYERCERRLDVIEFVQVCTALNTPPYEVLDQVQDSLRT